MAMSSEQDFHPAREAAAGPANWLLCAGEGRAAARKSTPMEMKIPQHGSSWEAFSISPLRIWRVMHHFLPLPRAAMELQIALQSETKDQLAIAEILKQRVEQQAEKILQRGVTPVREILQHNGADRKEGRVGESEDQNGQVRARHGDSRQKRERNCQIAHKLHGSPERLDVCMEGEAEQAHYAVVPVEVHRRVLPQRLTEPHLPAPALAGKHAHRRWTLHPANGIRAERHSEAPLLLPPPAMKAKD